MFSLIFIIVVFSITLFTPFLECPSTLKCLKFISSLEGNKRWSKNLVPKCGAEGVGSLNKMQEGIIKVTVQFPDGSPIEPKGFLSK
jgi:hypothetical protein